MARWVFDSKYTQRHLYHVKLVCSCGSIAPKITVWVHRGPLQDPFRRYQFGVTARVRIHACTATGRRLQASPDHHSAALPPGKAACAPKSPPTAAVLATLLPGGASRLTHGAPYNRFHGAAARRPSGGGAVHLGLTEGLRAQGGRVREWDMCPRAWGASGGARGGGARTEHGCHGISTKEG